MANKSDIAEKLFVKYVGHYALETDIEIIKRHVLGMAKQAHLQAEIFFNYKPEEQT